MEVQRALRKSALHKSPERCRASCVLLQPSIIEERPPEGPARGRWEVAPWVIVLLVTVALLGSIAFWLVRWRVLKSRQARLERAARGDKH